MPDSRTNTPEVDVVEYRAKSTGAGEYISVDVVTREENVDDEEIVVEPVPKVITKTLSFAPTMVVHNKKYVLDLGRNYLTGSGLYVRSSGYLQTQYVVPLVDFGTGDVGELEYGYAHIPLDIDDQDDADYYRDQAAELGISVDDVPHRTQNSYE